MITQNSDGRQVVTYDSIGKYPDLTGSETIYLEDEMVSISSSTDTITTSVPNIGTGINGQHSRIVNVGAHLITIQDQSQLTGSGVSFQGNANLILAPKESVELLYLDAFESWIQITQKTTY